MKSRGRHVCNHGSRSWLIVVVTTVPLTVTAIIVYLNVTIIEESRIIFIVFIY